MPRPFLLLSIFCLAAAGGCVRYEYDRVQPGELRRHIGSKSAESLRLDPLEYQLKAVENRLVMRVVNPTSQAVQLLGRQSIVVDPQGQSHPLPDRAIAPGSHIRLVFPPLRPRFERVGPSVGFGLGVGFSRFHGYPDWPHHYSPYYPWYYDPPRYLYVYDDGVYYWDWTGEGEIRVILVYQFVDGAGGKSEVRAGAGAGEPVRHTFVFQRRKM